MAYKMKHKHKDFPYKTPTGPVAEKKKIDRKKFEEENRIEHNVEAKMDEHPLRHIHHDVKKKIKENKQRSRDANKQERIEDALGL